MLLQETLYFVPGRHRRLSSWPLDRNRSDGRSKKGTPCNRGTAHQPHCKSRIECVPGGGRIHSVYRKRGDPLFRESPLGDEATTRSQLQQDVLDTATQKTLCRCIGALVTILKVGPKQFPGFSFVWRNPGHPAKQGSGKLARRRWVEHERDVVLLCELGQVVNCF